MDSKGTSLSKLDGSSYLISGQFYNLLNLGETQPVAFFFMGSVSLIAFLENMSKILFGYPRTLISNFKNNPIAFRIKIYLDNTVLVAEFDCIMLEFGSEFGITASRLCFYPMVRDGRQAFENARNGKITEALGETENGL
nr:hypothetical protein [Anaerobium acetethylicum]